MWMTHRWWIVLVGRKEAAELPHRGNSYLSSCLKSLMKHSMHRHKFFLNYIKLPIENLAEQRMSQSCLLCVENQVNQKCAHIYKSNVGLVYMWLQLYMTGKRERSSCHRYCFPASLLEMNGGGRKNGSQWKLQEKGEGNKPRKPCPSGAKPVHFLSVLKVTQ